MNVPSDHLQRADAILAAVEAANADALTRTNEILTLDLAVANTHIALATAQLLARRCQS